MKNKQSDWRLKLIRFMQGRYGRFDLLSKHLLVLSVVIMFANIGINSRLLSLITLTGMIVSYYRLFSKKIYVRSHENQRYTAWWVKFKKPFDSKRKQLKHRKTHRYYTCSSCQQQIRVPRNRGKIMITCPNCHHKFTKKT